MRGSIDQGLQAVATTNICLPLMQQPRRVSPTPLKQAEELIAGKPKKLAVILSAYPAGIPPHLLVTSDPSGKSNSEIDS